MAIFFAKFDKMGGHRPGEESMWLGFEGLLEVLKVRLGFVVWLRGKFP
jgi:hypothetical protein